MRNRNIERAVRLTLVTAGSLAAGTSGLAWAQEQDQPQAGQGQPAEMEQIVVTGSRIAMPNMEAISPVTAISSEEIKATGQTRVEDILNRLPQVFAEQGSTVSNGSNGTATVNLRGLGSNRTLVLINGRRMAAGDPAGSNAADLNQIPGALIERVDVLTGGASSVYGADAVAGVVNFIMQKDFEGLRLDVNGSTNWHKNSNDEARAVIGDSFPVAKGEKTEGDAIDITAIVGGNFGEGKGNATAYIGYRSVDAVLQSAYDYSSCTFGSKDREEDGTYAGNGQRFDCGGSFTSYPGYFELVGDPQGYTIGEGNVLRPFDTATDLYNYGPLNYYQRPDERYTAGVFAHYEFSDAADVYTEFMYMKDRSVAQIAPSGIFFDPPINVRCDNPMLSPDMVQTWCAANGLAGDDEFQLYIGRRNVEGGGRQSDLTHTSYRAVLGLRGALSSAWDYDAFAMQAETDLSNVYRNDFYKDRVQQAIDVTLDGDGNLVCRDDSNGCVPWNIFAIGGVTPEATNFLQVPALLTGTATTRVASVNFTGDLGEYGLTLPTAKDGIGVNVGAEWRDETTRYEPDYIYQTGALTGQGGTTNPVYGSFTVKEAFLETRVPLIQDMPFADSLSFEGGYRYSDYDLGFSTDSWKVGLEWAPIPDLRFRGGMNRAVRAPNIGELFSPQSVALDGTTDPCAGTNPVAGNPLATPENCARTGVLPGQYGTIVPNAANQYNGLLGGNPDLQPETADTTTFGVVVQPSILPGLSVAVDYFDIKIEDVINGVGADLAINSCLATGDPLFCDLIKRAPGSGSLWRSPEGYIIDTLQNLGELSTKGIDLDARYTFETEALGTFTTSLIATQLLELNTQPLPNGNTYDCAGLYGTVCGTPNPEWRHTLREQWETPWDGLALSVAWRYIDKVDLDATDSNEAFAGAPLIDSDRVMDSRSYIDIGATWTMADQYTLRFGINNVLDEDPPLVGDSNCPTGICNGNTYAQVYDVLGRYVFLGVTADF